MTRQLPWPVLVLPQPWFTHCCWGFFSADFCEALLGARQGLPVFPGCKSSPPPWWSHLQICLSPSPHFVPQVILLIHWLLTTW